MVLLPRMKLLEMMTSLISLKAWQYFITNKILNVFKFLNFKFLNFKSFNGVPYTKLATSICNLSDFSMLIVYKKIIQTLQNLLGTLPT